MIPFSVQRAQHLVSGQLVNFAKRRLICFLYMQISRHADFLSTNLLLAEETIVHDVGCADYQVMVYAISKAFRRSTNVSDPPLPVQRAMRGRVMR